MVASAAIVFLVLSCDNGAREYAQTSDADYAEIFQTAQKTHNLLLPEDARPVAAPPPLRADTTYGAPAELLGIRLEHGEQTLREQTPTFTINRPLLITLYYHVHSARFRDAATRITVTAPGHAPSHRYFGKFPVSAIREGISVGGLAVQECTLPMPVRRFVGRGLLTVELEYSLGDKRSIAVLYTVPVQVPAIAWDSDLTEDDIADTFDGDSMRLDKSFMLGPEASIELPVLPAQPVTAIGVVGWLTQPVPFDYGSPIAAAKLIGDHDVIVDEVVLHLGDPLRYHFALRDQLPEGLRRYVAPAEAPHHTHHAHRIDLGAPTSVAKLRFSFLPDAGALLVSDVVLFFE